MRWSDVMSPVAPRTLRQFAGLWLVFFGSLACWQWLFAGNMTRGVVCAALAAIVGPLGLLFPGAVRPVYRASLMLAFPVGWIVSHVILMVLFLAVFTPLALIFRAMGRDLLELKFRRGKETYWQPKPPCEVKRYFYQY